MDVCSTSLPDLITAIKVRIKQLAGLATLQKLNIKMKTKFLDHFPSDIPYITELLWEVYYHIELLPSAPVLVAWAYGCPWKYQARWKTLMDQHVAAGHIRPSSSPSSSPSFISPKADLTVLPWWVNDYHHLNRLTIPDNYPLP